jgi:hypothetical protein
MLESIEVAITRSLRIQKVESLWNTIYIVLRVRARPKGNVL